MAQILIRDVDPELVARLKERAKRKHRSLQGEIKAILEDAIGKPMDREAMLAMIDKWQSYWKAQGKTFSDSTEMIREDRDSR